MEFFKMEKYIYKVGEKERESQRERKRERERERVKEKAKKTFCTVLLITQSNTLYSGSQFIK
jgi:hypothetical protein